VVLVTTFSAQLLHYCAQAELDMPSMECCQAPHAVLTYPFACGRAAAAGIAARAGPLLRRAAVAQWEARLRIAGGGAWRLVASSPTGEELALTRACSRYDGGACLSSPTSCHHGADGSLMGRTSLPRLSFCPLNRHSTPRQHVNRTSTPRQLYASDCSCEFVTQHEVFLKRSVHSLGPLSGSDSKLEF